METRDMNERVASAEIDRLRAENARLREALNGVCDALFHDAVNGHLLNSQAIQREELGAVYELARAALAESGK